MQTVSVEFDFGPVAGMVHEALMPELAAAPPGRSRAALRRDGDTLTLLIEAEDVVSLRAALNTWLRLARVAEEMLDACRAA